MECNEYIQDFKNFVNKSRQLDGMFEELEHQEETGEIAGKVNEDFMLQLRQIFNLPLPPEAEVEITYQSDSDLIDDLNEIENFQLEDDHDEVEYLLEQSDPDQLEVEMHSDPSEKITFDEEIKEFDNDSYVFEEFSIDLSQQGEDNEEHHDQSHERSEDQNHEENDEADDLSHYFDFSCHLCDEKFNKMCFLALHTRTVHESLPRVLCLCGKFLGSSKRLQLHYEDHIKNDSVMFRCDDCNKSYKSKAFYNNHLKVCHEDSESRKHQCQCGKSFKEARHLAVHTNSHLPHEQKFIHVCTYCEKKYSSVFSLRQHIKHVHVNVSLICWF